MTSSDSLPNRFMQEWDKLFDLKQCKDFDSFPACDDCSSFNIALLHHSEQEIGSDAVHQDYLLGITSAVTTRAVLTNKLQSALDKSSCQAHLDVPMDLDALYTHYKA